MRRLYWPVMAVIKKPAGAVPFTWSQALSRELKKPVVLYASENKNLSFGYLVAFPRRKWVTAVGCWNDALFELEMAEITHWYCLDFDTGELTGHTWESTNYTELNF